MGGRLRVPVANRTGLSLTAIGRADSSDASACYVDGHSGLTGRKRPEVAETAERVKLCATTEDQSRPHERCR
jgi:hypothetical protein